MGVSVMRMGANSVVEAELGLFNGQIFAAIAVVHVVGSGQQNGPQVVQSAGVVWPQSKSRKKKKKISNKKLDRQDGGKLLPHIFISQLMLLSCFYYACCLHKSCA